MAATVAAAAALTPCSLLEDARPPAVQYSSAVLCLDLNGRGATGKRAVVLRAGDGASSSTIGAMVVACALASVRQTTRRTSSSLNFLLPKRRMLNGLPLLTPPSKKAPKGSSNVGALKVDAVVVTENWLVSNEAAAAAAAEEAMTLAKAAAMAASDAAAYAQAQSVTFDSQEFPSEMDLLRLERARLSEMERFQMIELDMEPDVSQTENTYRNSQLGTMSDGSTAVANKATEALAVGLQTDFQFEDETHDSGDSKGREDVMVRSSRRVHRLQKRERALEKAEKVAAIIASNSAHFRPKKIQGAQELSDPICSYLRDIGRTKLLTAAEEVELSRGIQDLLKLEKVRSNLKEEIGHEPTMVEWACAAGMEQNPFETRIRNGRFCKDKMVNSNLRLVVSIAKNYQGRGMTLQDLIQEGSMGLIRGAEKFDPNKGFKFSTYAHWWIRQAVTRAIADQSRTIRLPIHLYEVISRINKAKKMLAQEHGRQPHDEEVAELVGMTVDKLKTVVKSARAPTSMERPIGKEKDSTVGDLVPDRGIESAEDAISKQLLKQDLAAVLHTLNPRERDVLRLRYGLDDGRTKTLEEIGHIFRVTRERIRQIEAKAMRKLRQPSRNNALREYLEIC
ncbi:hypothetical protein BDL97_12G058000 [Sphagnum fallax]|nr:hypothetical protein BDL97_12G058000 [Sphagnum fallax]